MCLLLLLLSLSLSLCVCVCACVCPSLSHSVPLCLFRTLSLTCDSKHLFGEELKATLLLEKELALNVGAKDHVHRPHLFMHTHTHLCVCARARVCVCMCVCVCARALAYELAN